jgi:hypothetical protein
MCTSLHHLTLNLFDLPSKNHLRRLCDVRVAIVFVLAVAKT